MIKLSLGVALGSAVGGLLRYWFTAWAAALSPANPHVATIAVNTTGSFVIGVLAVIFARQQPAPFWPLVLMTGVLGGFTTFSAFSLQTLTLVQQGRWSAAFANVLLSVLLCLGAVWLGWHVGAIDQR